MMKSPEFYMLQGISADENERLQAMANALERRMFKLTRIKEPCQNFAHFDVRCVLQRAGWIRVRAEWVGGDTLIVNAQAGVKLKARRLGLKLLSAESCLFSDFLGAVRQAGLKPGIEDISVRLQDQEVEAIVNAVPMAGSSPVLNRMVGRWFDRNLAKARCDPNQIMK